MRPSAGNLSPTSNWQARTGFAAGPTKVTRKATQGSGKATQGSGAVPSDRNIPASEVLDIAQDQMDQIWPGDDEPPTEDQPDVAPEEDLEIPTGLTGETETRTRSGRISRKTEKWTESLQQQKEGIVSLHVAWEVFHDDGYLIQEEMADPIAFAALANPDIMYLHQAMKEPNSKQFK
jgi:hypothetical protein